MKPPFQLGDALPAEVWQAVRLRAMFDCCKWDVQSEDHCVLAEFPLLMDVQEWKKLCAIAEALSSELVEAEQELLRRKELLGPLGLPRELKKCFRGVSEPSRGLARVMRFDFHFTDRGWRISEVNADVPGGFIEGSGFTRLMAHHYPGTTAAGDPADLYARTMATALRPGALVHATAYSDDRQVMQFLAKRFNQYGLRTILASPAHVQWQEHRASIVSSFADSRLNAVVRFFPAEWFPTLQRKPQWIPFFCSSRTPISNPCSAVLVQSKRFPLVWDSLSTALPTWRAVLPYTTCPSMVMKNLQDWVVKPALGRVGEDIAIADITSDRKVEKIHQAARSHPSNWVAQQRFNVLPLSNRNGTYYPSIGVFTVDGNVAGAYARIGRKALIDDEAQDIAVLITASGGQA